MSASSFAIRRIISRQSLFSAMSTINLTQLDIESLVVLQSTLPANALWLVLGSVAIMNNLLLIATLYMGRKKHTGNFHRNVAHLAFADLLVGLILMGVGSKRIYHNLNNIPTTATPLRCSIDQGSIMFGMQASVTQTLCLATDRLIAVMFPLYYRNELSPEISQMANIILWVLSIIISAMGSVIGLRNDSYISSCSQTSVYNSIFFKFFAFLMLFYSVFIISEYAAVMYSIRTSMRKAKRENKDTNEVKAGLQVHILASLQIVIAIYIATWLCASVASDLLSWFTTLERSRLITPYLIALMGVNSALNFPIYLWKIQEMREDFLTAVSRLCKSRIGPATLAHLDSVNMPT